MPIPAVGAILSGTARAVATGGARAAMGGAREAARGAIRGAVKKTIGGRTNKKIGSPIKSGSITSTKGGGIGPGGGSIVPPGSSIGSLIVPSPKSEIVVAKKSGSRNPILDSLVNIKSLLEQILKVEREEKSNLEDTILEFVRSDERRKRDEEQERQEERKTKGKKKKQSPIVKGAKKAVSGLWNLISDFVKDFIQYKILAWFGDPKNKKNVRRIVDFFHGLVKFLGVVFDFTMNQIGSLAGVLTNSFKIFGAIIQPLLDILTLKWLTNPKEFLDNIINLPKTILTAVPELFKSLIDFITFGLFDNMGKFVSDIISNLNPFKIFGGGEEKESSSEIEGNKEQQKTDSKGTGTSDVLGSALGALNPMNWFGGDKKDSSKQEVDTSNLPKLAVGGIVSPPETKEKSGVTQNNKMVSTGEATVEPLSNIVNASGVSSLIMKGMKPFMDMLIAPFKIIGTAIVGLILKTVSKIPFVGNIIEPIITMAASSFGVPSSVIGQLKTSTREDTEIKEIDKEKLLEKLFGGLKDVKDSIEAAKETGGNIFQSFFAGMGSIGGAIGGFLSKAFTPAAAAATLPGGAVGGGGGGGGATGGAPSAPSYEDFDANKTYKSGDIVKKDGQLKEFDGMGWGAVKSPGPSLASAAASLRGMSSASGPDGGANGCVWAVNKVYEKAGITPPWGSSLYVPTAESKMINAGYQQVSYDQRQPGDVMVMYDQKSPPQAHIGVVLENGKVLSNSSSRAAFSWEATPEAYNREYGGTGKIYRMPGAGNSSMIAQKSRPSQSQIQTNISSTGSSLQKVQQESLGLQATGKTSSGNVSFLNMGGNQSSGMQTSTSSSSSLGLTIPSSGLWSIYKTNL